MNTMTNNVSGARLEEREHLSEDQIDEELMGDLQGQAAAHLADCDHCMQRVAKAGETIASFKEVTMAWSERRSATMPLPVMPVQGAWWQRRAGWAMASVALAFGIALTGSRNTATPLQPAETATVANEETAGTKAVAVEAKFDASSEQMPADNRMLKAIDSELNASVESPAVLGLEPTGDQAPAEDDQSLLEN